MIIYALPFIAALIGWFTHSLLISLLFHPAKEISIPGIKIQGLFPKRQQELAGKLGALVAREFVSFKGITDKINQPDTVRKVMPFIENHIDQYINVKLKEEVPLLAMFINEETMGGIKKGLIGEIEVLFPALISQMTANLEQDLDIENMIAEKVKALSSGKLEEMVHSGLRKELQFIKIIGALLGFIIGLILLLLTLF